MGIEDTHGPTSDRVLGGGVDFLITSPYAVVTANSERDQWLVYVNVGVPGVAMNACSIADVALRVVSEAMTEVGKVTPALAFAPAATPLGREEIAELRRLAATSECWSRRPWTALDRDADHIGVTDARQSPVLDLEENWGFEVEEDRDYVVAAANNLPRCLDIIEAQANEIHDLRNRAAGVESALDEMLDRVDELDWAAEAGVDPSEMLAALSEFRAYIRAHRANGRELQTTVQQASVRRNNELEQALQKVLGYVRSESIGMDERVIERMILEVIGE